MKILLILSISFVLLSSCKKDKNEQFLEDKNLFTKGMETVHLAKYGMSFLEFYVADYDGNVIIQEHHPINYSTSKTMNISAGFDITGIDEYDINDGDYNIEGSDDCEFVYFEDNETSFFGEEFKFEFLENGTVRFKDSVYVPNRLNVTYDDSIIDENDLVTWNSDASNDDGIAVLINYSPSISDQLGGKSTGSTVSNYTLISDDGSYNLEGDLFDDIPDSSYVMLSLARGAWVLSASVDEDHSDTLKTLVFSHASMMYFHTTD